MKKIITIFTFVILMVVLILNITINDKTYKNNYSIQNIEALKLSAGSAECKAITENKCVLKIKDVTIEGVGQPFIQL